MSRLALPIVFAVVVAAAPLLAQGTVAPIPLVGVGFGVDTTAPDVGAIVRLLRAYLSGPGLLGDNEARAAGLWRDAGRTAGPVGDVTRGSVYKGFPATVVGIVSAAPGDSLYVVKVLYARRGRGRSTVEPLALQRLYAVRAPAAPYGWQLSSALPRVTRDWERRTVGRIRFWYAPGQRPDSARAARAVAFVDSVAALFGVPAPPRIDYYVTGSPDEYLRATGIDFFPLPSGRGSGTGGQAMGGVVLAGDPSLGEAYLHELAHVVLAPICCGNPVIGEGVATWLAGSRGRPATELYGALAAYQASHPKATLRKLLDDDLDGVWGPAENDALYATGALFVEAVYRRAGLDGVRRLARAPADTKGLLAALRRELPTQIDDPERWWRGAAAAYAGAAAGA